MCRIELHGHACVSVTFQDGRRLCLDPYESRGFGGAMHLAPLPDHFAWVACTHAHTDHAAVHTIPSAVRISTPFVEPSGLFALQGRLAPHDEHAGRLRGGLVELLWLRVGATSVLHLGDLGERPGGATLRWLTGRPVDVLVGPAGGHFTLGADGFAELVALVRPRIAVACHTWDDGGRFAEVAGASAVEQRFETVLRGDALAHVAEGWELDGARWQDVVGTPTLVRLRPQSLLT